MNDVKVTRQGVRDLGGNEGRRKKPELTAIKQCEHKRMHQSRGEWKCPDCGLSWNESNI
jgi:PHP family Zn ribbon phosphoesterase